MKRLRLALDAAQCQDRARSTELEWLETDGRGGYACGTVSGVPTRRYHGLLLTALHPPHQRAMLVNHLDESVEVNGKRFVLSTGTVAVDHEDGHARCLEFQARPCPRWRYRVGDVEIVRSVLCPRGRGAVVMRWELGAGAREAVRLRLRPMLTGRRDHAVFEAGDLRDHDAKRVEGGVSWQPRPDFPRVHAGGRFGYRHAPTWRHGVTYAIDEERGESCREDWWSPGELSFELASDTPALLTLSVDPASDGGRLFDEELARRRTRDAAVPARDHPLFDELAVTAESYIVEMGAGTALLAGVPWFDVWTRDAFTALPGLLVATGRLDTAAAVIGLFSGLVEGGMLPNNLPDAVTEPRWSSVDASLWFIVSVGRYLERASPRPPLVPATWRAIRDIVDGYTRGTAHVSIRVDDDGLVSAHSEDAPLTWMDAQYEGEIFTPRRGKPVEVQALWVKALAVAATLARRQGDQERAARWEALRERAVTSFRARFWNASGGYLYDVVDGPDGDDATLRPSQLFALSLDRALVPDAWAGRALAVIHRELLTPLGLRTLPVSDPRFQPAYRGPRAARDPAYHQGTVWPFLLGPFLSAWLRVHGDSPAVRAQALGFLGGIERHVTSEGCLGHISEIFDGLAPHAPRGCFAQAWSLGELLFGLGELLAAPRAGGDQATGDRSS